MALLIGRIGERLEAFASEHGPRFYGLPLNEGTVTLRREPTPIPALIERGELRLVPFHAGETLGWRLAPKRGPVRAASERG